MSSKCLFCSNAQHKHKRHIVEHTKGQHEHCLHGHALKRVYSIPQHRPNRHVVEHTKGATCMYMPSKLPMPPSGTSLAKYEKSPRSAYLSASFDALSCLLRSAMECSKYTSSTLSSVYCEGICIPWLGLCLC